MSPDVKGPHANKTGESRKGSQTVDETPTHGLL